MAREFMEECGFTFRTVLDSSTEATSVAFTDYKACCAPLHYVIDRERKIALAQPGFEEGYGKILKALAALGVDTGVEQPDASLTGYVFDADGRPVSDCSVKADNVRFVGNKGPDWVLLRAQTDANGFFSFAGLPAGEFDLSVCKKGVVCWSPGGSVTLGEDGQTEFTIRLLPGVARGKVSIEGGETVDTDEILVVAKKEGDPNARARWMATISENRTFEIQNLPAGSFEVTGFLDGYFGPSQVFFIEDGMAVAGLDVKLLRAGSVLFKITDRDGNLLSGVDVSNITSGVESTRLFTGMLPKGRIRVVCLKPGLSTFRVGSQELGFVERTVEVKAGEETVVSITIE